MPGRLLLPLALLTAAAVLGCGPSSSGDGPDHVGETPTRIDLAPLAATIVVKNGVPAAQAYTATASWADGSSSDVTAQATFAIDAADLATFAGATATASGGRAGVSGVSATLSGMTGAASLTVRIEQTRVDPAAPANVVDLFEVAIDDPARAPTVVYPADQTLVPPNLGTFDVHWRDATGNDLWEVSMTSALVDLRVYTPATAPASFVTFTAPEWRVIADSHRAGSVKVVVRGLAGAAPATVGQSAPLSLSFGKDDLQGGLYYWAASAAGIFRHDFGRPDEVAQPFYAQGAGTTRCVACHSLSRDGTRMIVSHEGGGSAGNTDGAMTVIDVASRQPLFADDGSVARANFSTFAPDAQSFLASFDGVITWRDAATGAVKQTVPTQTKATHPDWSSVGDRIVWASYETGADWTTAGGGALYTQAFDAASETFGAPALLVAPPGAGLRNYYPTFSPDGKWVLFNVSSEDFYDDTTAQIWVVPTDGAIAPALLAAANLGSGLTNSWARWAPFEQDTGGEQSEKIFWFTVSSKRDFGVRLVNAGLEPALQRPQLWMAPFYPARALAGQDSGRPMFWLPFQDLATSNHIAQWTEVVVPIE